MKLITNFSYLILTLWCLIIYTSCHRNECIGVSDSTDTKYYKDFDFFKLEGKEEIESSTMCYPFLGVQKREDNISTYIHTEEEIGIPTSYFKKTGTQRVLDKVLDNGEFIYHNVTKEYWESYQLISLTDNYKKAQISFYLDSQNVMIDYTITRSTGKREVNCIAIIEPSNIKEYTFKEDSVVFTGDTARITWDSYNLWNSYNNYISEVSLEKKLKYKKEITFLREDNLLFCKEVITEGATDTIISEDNIEYDYDYFSLFWWYRTKYKYEN